MNRMLAALTGARPQPTLPPVSKPSARPGETEAVGKSELSEYELTKLVQFADEKSASLGISNAAAKPHNLTGQSAADARFTAPTHQPAGRFIDVRA